MKKLFLIPLALGLTFCHCQKTAVAQTLTKSSVESTCPENGVCTIQIQKGKIWIFVVTPVSLNIILFTVQPEIRLKLI